MACFIAFRRTVLSALGFGRINVAVSVAYIAKQPETKKVWVAFLIVFIGLLFGCEGKVNPSLFSKSRNNRYNFLKLTKSGYNYKGNELYYINTPYPILHENFLYHNYLRVDGRKLSVVELYDDCKNNYIEGDYKFLKGANLYTYFHKCDIVISPFIDFSLKPGDTLKYYSEWVRLDKKFYDKKVNDTLYKFRRFRGLEVLEQTQTIIIANDNIGILGVYDTSTVFADAKIRVHPIGYTMKTGAKPLRAFKIRKPTVKLETIKEFVRD